MKLTCMIVDDDPMARKALENLCSRTELVEVVAICGSAEEALAVLKEQEVDLIFLDIQMPGLSGLEFLEQTPSLPQIIITTGNIEYAYDAFEYQVTDFLKKPISLPRFLRAVKKAADFQEKLAAFQAHSDDIYIRQEGRYLRIPVSEIQFFENIGDYVRIKTDKEAFLIHSTLKNVSEKLHDPRFIKVHRSYIINLTKIKDIQESNLVIDKNVIPISRANRPVLLNRLRIL